MNERCPHRRRPRRQRGAALLTAMIIVTLVVTLASSMVWQQWRAVQVEQAERARTQAAWILSGALDFARLILKEDLKSGRPTALTEPWATPLAEARLSTFLAADGSSNADDGPEAFLSGKIADAQARYNLSNLVTADGKIDAEEFATLERLCLAVGMDSAVAQRIAGGMRDATYPGTDPNANAPLLPQSVAQLSWLGLDAASIAMLETVVVVLPAPTPVNVNTASREVLVGAVKGLDLATAERILQVRQRTPFKTLQVFYDQVPTLMPLTAKLDVKSSYFEVSGKLRLADRVLVERSLVHRLANGEIRVLRRDRVASLEEVAS
jgi:general secretion pathway protein K